MPAKFFDYHTAPVDLLKGDVIDVNKTGVSFYDQLLPNSDEKEYMRKEKNLVGTIEYMTPQEYYEMCSQYGFPNKIVPVEKLKQERRIDKNTLEHLKLVLTEYGHKFPIPYVSIAERGQEGLHRMMVIGDMFGWDNAKYPVLVIRYADEERAQIEKENKIINKYSSYIRQAVRSTLQYKFTDFDELKEQLQFDLDREFRYVDEVNKPVNFNIIEDPEDDNYYLVKVGKAQADLEKALVKWVEPQTDIDDELDLDDLELDDTEDFLRRYFGDDWRETNPELKKTFGIKEALSKNLSNIVSNISSPEELMDWMDKNITYELANDNYGAENDPPTKTAQEVLETGTGHCAEQSYLEKEVLDNLGYETFLVMVKENSSKKDYGADGSAHVFLVYKEGKNYCWFEHSMQHAKGIHKYTSLKALLQDVANQWWRYDENSDILEVRMMDKVITGVDNWGLAKECYKLPVEYTFDISNNIMESDVSLEESVSSNSQIEYLPVSDIELFKDIEQGWSRETAHPTAQKYWTEEKPSLGQCAITALYLNEKYGYSIWETLINNCNRHFFNKDNDGNIIDLTKDQFSSNVEIDYENSRQRDPKQLLRSCNTRYQLFKKNLNTNISEDVKRLDIEQMDQYVIREFSQDDPGEGCIFIHPNGKFINIYPKLDDHEDLCYWLEEQGFDENPEDASWFVDEFKYIRCRNSLYLCFVDLPIHVTREQLDSLQLWLETKVSSDTLDICTPDECKNYNLEDYFPEDIIKLIKRYFSSGKLYEDIC